MHEDVRDLWANASAKKKLEKGDPSPLSSPALGPLSSSPEQTTTLDFRNRSDGNLSIPSYGEPLRLSMDASVSSNDYDHLPR
jgi:protein-serine/threonine kinase